MRPQVSQASVRILSCTRRVCLFNCPLAENFLGHVGHWKDPSPVFLAPIELDLSSKIVKVWLSSQDPMEVAFENIDVHRVCSCVSGNTAQPPRMGMFKAGGWHVTQEPERVPREPLRFINLTNICRNISSSFRMDMFWLICFSRGNCGNGRKAKGASRPKDFFRLPSLCWSLWSGCFTLRSSRRIEPTCCA